MIKNIPAPFTQKQYDYFVRSLKSWFNVAEGGKRGGKNVLQTTAFASVLDYHPSRLHLVAGVSSATAKLNVLDCDGYGLMNYFWGRCRAGEYQNRECLYIDAIRGGQKVVLVSGGGKSGDEKLIKGNTYGTAYVTEANECAPSFLKEVFDRTISSKDRKIYHDLNPKAENHWYYQDILHFHEQKQAIEPLYGYNYGHFTLADNMSIDDKQLHEILKTYDKNTIWYMRDILGERKQVEGLIYDMFNPETNTGHVFDDSMELPVRGQTYVAVDYGTVNPMAFLDIWYDDHSAYVRREFYYDSHSDPNNPKLKTDYDYGIDMDEFIGAQRKEIVIDPSAASFKAELAKRRHKFSDADNDVIDGIRMVASMFSQRRLFIHKSCVNLIRELLSYSWDEKARQRDEERPLKLNDHACDALRYFVKTIVGKRRFNPRVLT